MNAISLSIFSSRINAICEEMGAVLRRAAFSPNIKDRLDFSCAVFDSKGELCAQAAHIPVHLGSMAFAMKDIVVCKVWEPGDIVIVNDPFLGGTHLPDITLVAPVFSGEHCAGFVVNRAHHADIGADTPGSMPISCRLEEEGVVIPPTLLCQHDEVLAAVIEPLLDKLASPSHALADFSAQISAARTGRRRVVELIERMGLAAYQSGLLSLNQYSETLARQALLTIPDGEYQFTDYMDDDGCGQENIPLKVNITVKGSDVNVDFSGTAPQVGGNINCPLSVAAAGVFYVFRCLMPQATPASAGCFRPLHITAPQGCLLNAERPAAVVAGNVETSSRVVDVVLGALAQAIPDKIAAASQGTMNNIAMGSRSKRRDWDYYETLGGGMGAYSGGNGLSAVQTHMTNTLNTPIEALEQHYPLRVTRYAIRKNSGGAGRFKGGDGLVREYTFLDDANITLLTERRKLRPWGLGGGEEGASGENYLNEQLLPAKCMRELKAGDRLRIETPGGGGWGSKEK